MKTRIITLTGVLYDGDADAVHARTKSGDITILDHHQPLLSILARESVIRVESQSGLQSIEAPSGFLHLDGNNELTVLVD